MERELLISGSAYILIFNYSFDKFTNSWVLWIKSTVAQDSRWLTFSVSNTALSLSWKRYWSLCLTWRNYLHASIKARWAASQGTQAGESASVSHVCLSIVLHWGWKASRGTERMISSHRRNPKWPQRFYRSPAVKPIRLPIFKRVDALPEDYWCNVCRWSDVIMPYLLCLKDYILLFSLPDRFLDVDSYSTYSPWKWCQ